MRTTDNWLSLGELRATSSIRELNTQTWAEDEEMGRVCFLGPRKWLSTKGAYTFTINFSATYLDYFASINGPLPYGPYLPTEIWINRLVPLSVVLNSTTAGQLMDAFKSAVAVGCNWLSVATDGERRKHPDNAVFSAWRDAIAACSLTTFCDYEAALEENLAVKETLVSVYAPPIEAVTPGSGVYLNEADP
ncbi:hypothetical protein F4824DRAFT_500180 [Ustulina deusta]|nr:hypothetical protein F4824DRAFT_500180 [Ustulina deusta]